MHFIQLIRENATKMSHKLTIPLVTISLMAFLLTVTIFHQSSRIEHLEKRSIQQGVPQSTQSYSGGEEFVEKAIFPGSLYTRWGRTTCTPGLSDAVYTGIAGGQHYSHRGGGSNMLCLPMDPLWGNYTSGFESTASIYGTEYEVSRYSTPIFSDANTRSLHDQDVPCTVCQTKTPATIFMLPARNQCYSGWTLEYSGYLMTEHYNDNGRTEYLCVDKEPEADPAGYRNDNGVVLYNVQGVCGSLPCSPYVNGRELTCAVCSKRQSTIRYKLGAKK